MVTDDRAPGAPAPGHGRPTVRCGLRRGRAEPKWRGRGDGVDRDAVPRAFEREGTGAGRGDGR
ncbi:Uncharacterised protein [Amycolatopsis camponoti]|uniref:Uncharacterized protein n=1 Tax=Amycolatopsis camponoti TaxID=2606593 RepID=A0A6I8LKL8_9PSEU|nr:Uncharacterised protein [Amycolatopsis camponoti]